MSNPFARSELLLGKQAIARLSSARVAVFGLGGVGGYVLEVLVRSGIGQLDLIDNDVIMPSNLNRQILATYQTLGMDKVDAAAARAREINPKVAVQLHKIFYMPDTAAQIPLDKYDYVVDAIDTVTAKLELVQRAYAAKVPIISCMGTGNKLDPTRFEVSDINKTSMCPLARIMRKELKKRGVPTLKVVYSRQQVLTPLPCAENENDAPLRKQPTGSVAFVPAAAGIILGGEVVKDLLGQHRT